MNTILENLFRQGVRVSFFEQNRPMVLLEEPKLVKITDWEPEIMSLANNIEQLRNQKQMSQPELADKAGVSKGYIYMLEAGEMTNPSLDVLMKIASALGSTIAELVGEPTVVAKSITLDIPDTLRQFARERKRVGEPLSEEDIVSLATTKFRGRRPETLDDWRYVYEFFKRTLGTQQ